MFVARVQPHLPLLSSLARRVLGNVQAAEDACQNALLTAWSQRHELRDVTRLKAWLATVVVNESFAVVRRRKIERKALRRTVTTVTGPADDPMTESLRRAAVVDALASLAEPMRIVVTLRFLQGLSGRETAELLAVSESSVSKILHQAMERLRVALKDWNHEQ